MLDSKMRNMQPNNNAENGAENNGQQPNNDDLDMPPDVEHDMITCMQKIIFIHNLVYLCIN